MEVQLWRSILVADVGKVRHTARQKVLLKAPLNRLIRCDWTVQFQKFREGERINDELHIASAEIGGELTGQELRVWAGDIDVAVKRYTEGVDTLLPVFYLLDLIKKQIDLTRDIRRSLGNLIMQCLRGLQMSVIQILKVDGDKLSRTDTRLHKFFFDQIQHDRFTAPANTSHDLYKIRSDKRTDALHIHFTFNHDNQPPYLWLSIV